MTAPSAVIARPGNAMACVNLATDIDRQRVVIEGWREGWVTEDECITYMEELAPLLNMKLIDPPSVSRSPAYGPACWGHWDFSGGELMAWDKWLGGKPWAFLTVDLYTCRPFIAYRAAEWSRAFWRFRTAPGKPCAMVSYEVLPHLVRST